MEGPRHPNGPKPQNPTAQRLGEILAAWFPDSSEGPYHQYLRALSPSYDHLLTYSRYDRVWRCVSQVSSSDVTCSEISLLASPVHVIDIDDQNGILDHRHFDGTKPEAMRDLQHHLSQYGSDHRNKSRRRLVCAQHITCFSMEALGSGLSLDPNVFSHHVGTSFKEIERSTSIDKLCDTNIKEIQSLVGAFERERNLQITKSSLGRLAFANVDHAKDLTSRGSVTKSIYCDHRYPVTLSVDVPRTVFLQGYQPEDDRSGIAGRQLRSRALGLQEPILNRRIARQRFADDSPLCDQGERYSQNGLDILQHITVHALEKRIDSSDQQVLILFPPYPEFEGMNDPYVFLDSFARTESIESFDEFLRNKAGNQVNAQTVQPRQTKAYDVEVFVCDILKDAAHIIPQEPAYFYNILRAYAVNAWFDRLQAVEDQLENLDYRMFTLEHAQEYSTSDAQSQGYLAGEHFLNEEGLRGALLRYALSLESETRQLELDLRAAEGRFGKEHDCVLVLGQTKEKYADVACRMGHMLSQTQHRLGMKQSLTNRALAHIQIQESRKSIEQAATVKRLTILAFFYIPLSCVCSAFGMNIREMDPHPSIWLFTAVAVCVTAITLMAASYHLILDSFRDICSWLCRLPYHFYWMRLYSGLYIREFFSKAKRKTHTSEP